jgi:hypothetical protein
MLAVSSRRSADRWKHTSSSKLIQRDEVVALYHIRPREWYDIEVADKRPSSEEEKKQLGIFNNKHKETDTDSGISPHGKRKAFKINAEYPLDNCRRSRMHVSEHVTTRAPTRIGFGKNLPHATCPAKLVFRII